MKNILSLYRFSIRRADGKETFVTTHQPDGCVGTIRADHLREIKQSILEHPHWKKFLSGQEGTVICTLRQTDHTFPKIRPGDPIKFRADSLLAAEPRIFEIK